MKKKLPTFRSEKEEASFWDTHDSTEYLGEFEPDTDTVFVRPESGVVELNSATWRRLLAEAKRRKTTPARLLETCIAEGLTSKHR